MKELQLIVFGLRRSGTTYCAESFRQNYNIEAEQNYWPRYRCNWKHGVETHVPEECPHDFRAVVIYRHPLSWLPSMYRLYRHGDCYQWPDEFFTSFKEFIDWRHDYAFGQSPFVKRWYSMYGYWLWKDCYPMIKYEDFLVDPESICDTIANKWGLEKTRDDFKLINGNVAPQSKTGSRYQLLEKNRKQEYMKYWTPGLLELLKKCSDLEILETLGYNPDVTIPPTID